MTVFTMHETHLVRTHDITFVGLDALKFCGIFESLEILDLTIEIPIYLARILREQWMS